jgi:hypothetical protein
VEGGKWEYKGREVVPNDAHVASPECGEGLVLFRESVSQVVVEDPSRGKI